MSLEQPLAIAHRGGNTLAKLEAAFAVNIAYSEIDLWFHRGRLEVRHDKAAWRLPIVWDRGALKLRWRKGLTFEVLLAAMGGRGRLLVDLKGEAEGLAAALAGSLKRAKAEESVAFCGGWAHLDRLSELLPQVQRFYTIGTLERLAALRPRLERGEIAGVSINWRVLTEEIASELKEKGVESIVVWTVETREAAERVMGWGASGIISDSLPLLVAIQDGSIEVEGS